MKLNKLCKAGKSTLIIFAPSFSFVWQVARFAFGTACAARWGISYHWGSHYPSWHLARTCKKGCFFKAVRDVSPLKFAGSNWEIQSLLFCTGSQKSVWANSKWVRPAVAKTPSFLQLWCLITCIRQMKLRRRWGGSACRISVPCVASLNEELSHGGLPCTGKMDKGPVLLTCVF